MTAHFEGDLCLKVRFDPRTHLPILKDGRTTWRSIPPPDAGPIFCFVRKNGERLWFPPGLDTDLGSVPRIAWRVEPPDGPAVGGFVIHDMLYATHGTGLVGMLRCISRPQPYTRAEADHILLEAAEVLGVGVLSRDVLYASVRIGGDRGWGT